MNITLILELTVSFYYAVIIIQRTRTKMDKENIYTILVCMCLGWMAFAEGLFCSAPTKQSAWIWHQIGALGWSGFIGVTTWYFLEMSGVTKKISTFFKVIFWVPASLMTFRFVLFRPTALAEDLIQSESGLGWTFINSLHNYWMIVFLIYIAVYLGGILGYLCLRQKREKNDNKRHLTRSFVFLDVVSITTGVIIYFIIPLVTTYVPPMGWIPLLIFAIGYSYGIWEYDVNHFELVMNPQMILDSSIEPMMITDEEFHILYINRSMKSLFHEKEILNKNLIDLLPLNEQENFKNIDNIEEQPIHNVAINLKEDEAALISINQITARRKHQKFYMISMHDISQMRQTQIQMEHMAFYDELTGLANRRRLGELLDTWEKRYRINRKEFALIFLDLNDFKSINDHYGHDAGDQALISVSDMLERIKSPEDETFRLSGDEFVMLHMMKRNEQIQEIMQTIQREIQAIDTTAYAKEHKLNTSIGACRYSEFENVRKMMKTADERMYEMKQEYHNRPYLLDK